MRVWRWRHRSAPRDSCVLCGCAGVAVMWERARQDVNAQKNQKVSICVRVGHVLRCDTCLISEAARTMRHRRRTDLIAKVQRVWTTARRDPSAEAVPQAARSDWGAVALACSDCHERLPEADYDESTWERKRDRKCRACKSKKRKNQDDDSSRKKQRVDNNSDDSSRKKRVDRQSRSSRKAAKRQHR